jgi:DNA-binding beta-propeller fold protein YncE
LIPRVSVCPRDASQDAVNHRVRRVDLAAGATTTLAGSGTQGFRDGDGASAQFYTPSGVAIDPSGTFALVAVRTSPADALSTHTSLAARRVPTATTPRHWLSCLVTVCPPDASQDFRNNRVRRIDLATGATTTLAGSGTQGFSEGVGASAQFNHPSGVAIAPSGGFALVGVRA